MKAIKKISALLLMCFLAVLVVACGSDGVLEKPTKEDTVSIESLEVVANANETIANKLAKEDLTQEDLEKSLTLLNEQTIPTLKQMKNTTLDGKNLNKAYQLLADDALKNAETLKSIIESMIAGEEKDDAKIEKMVISTKETKEKITALLDA